MKVIHIHFKKRFAMKTKKMLGLSVFILMFSLGGVGHYPYGAGTAYNPGSIQLPLIKNALPGTFHKAIAGEYYKSGDYEKRTWNSIHNTNPVNSITLGTIYVFESTGRSGNITVWNGLEGEVIPPFGGVHFELKDTGVPQMNPGDIRQPLLTVITWDGQENDLQLTGAVAGYYSGKVIGYFDLLPF